MEKEMYVSDLRFKVDESVYEKLHEKAIELIRNNYFEKISARASYEFSFDDEEINKLVEEKFNGDFIKAIDEYIKFSIECMEMIDRDCFEKYVEWVTAVLDCDNDDFDTINLDEVELKFTLSDYNVTNWGYDKKEFIEFMELSI